MTIKEILASQGLTANVTIIRFGETVTKMVDKINKDKQMKSDDTVNWGS